MKVGSSAIPTPREPVRGSPAPHAAVTVMVKRIERGELEPSPDLVEVL